MEPKPNVLWLTAPIVILLALAAGWGVLADDLYRDLPSMVAQARAQDFVSLALVLPLLVVTAILAGRGSLRARLIWLGSLVYMVYTYVGYAFVVRYNPLFIAYIALLGCSLYALIAGLATLDHAAVRACVTKKTPGKAVAIYVGLLAILFYSVWLSELIPALLQGAIPASILKDGTPTNAIHVLDMAWILPAFAIVAVSLWRKLPLGYSLAGVMLAFCIQLLSAILAMGMMLARAGDPGAGPMIGLFAVLLVTTLGMLVWYLSRLDLSPAGRAAGSVERTGGSPVRP